jgi:hypothetical protein
MFCAAGLVFDGTEGAVVQFSSFALPDSFLAVPRERDPIFMFCAFRLVFDGTEGVESSFYILRSRTHFWRYRGRLVSYSSFALPDSFGAVPRT